MVARRRGYALGFTGGAGFGQPWSDARRGGYGGGMTTDPGPGHSEPTLRDVLAAIGNLAVSLENRFAGVEERLAGIGLRFDRVDEVLESLSGLAHDQQHALVQAEARITSRLEDVQRVVQAAKADLAAHASDTQLHRDTHGPAA